MVWPSSYNTGGIQNIKKALCCKEMVTRTALHRGTQSAEVQVFLTCLQQQLHDGEVRVGHAVVKSCVPIAISQIDKQL